MNIDYLDNRKDFYRSIPKFGAKAMSKTNQAESKQCLHCGKTFYRTSNCPSGSWKQKEFCSCKCRRAKYLKGGDYIRLSPVIDKFLMGRI